MRLASSSSSLSSVRTCVVRTSFVAAGTTGITNHTHHQNHHNLPNYTFAADITRQRSNTNNTAIQLLSTRRLSSSAIPEPKRLPPKKYVLPSNLTFDPRSQFVNMFDNFESHKPSGVTAVETAAAQPQSEAADDDTDSWYDENEDSDAEYDDDELFDDEGALLYPYQ